MQFATAHSGSLAAVIETLGKLAKWPAEQLFPVLDIFRLLVLHSSTARLLSADAGALEPANEGLGGLIARGLGASAPASKMVALRLACNCFVQAPLRSWLLQHAGKLLGLIAESVTTSSKPFRVALSTTLLNLGVAAHNRDWEQAPDAQMQMLSLIQQVRFLCMSCFPCVRPAALAFGTFLCCFLGSSSRVCALCSCADDGLCAVGSKTAQCPVVASHYLNACVLLQALSSTPPAEDDAIFRAVLAAGTVVAGNKEATQMAQGLGILQTVSTLTSEGSSEKNKAAAGDLNLMLQ